MLTDEYEELLLTAKIGISKGCLKTRIWYTEPQNISPTQSTITYTVQKSKTSIS